MLPDAPWVKRIKDLRLAEAAAGAEMFLSIPDRWYDDPTWRCVNGHISKRYLKTDRGGTCLACGKPVLLTCPEDKEEP